MDMRFENKSTFYISGYAMETNEATLEKDCAMLREKYEDKLRAISGHLYFLSWEAQEGVMTYLLGVETTSQTPATEGATCKEVPATRFAIATVPKDASILATWHEFFEKGILFLNATINMNHGFFLESLSENGACELWIPVEQ
ncbi:MAG: effector binding domain-containing protein [Defluviitaleaceae bacterium]|nr:effector binding domain-containing protein [Defluviitaleaceae bacterium]